MATITNLSSPRNGFQSRCRDLGVGERSAENSCWAMGGFSLVAEIWGLASGAFVIALLLFVFQSRCRDLGVGEDVRPSRRFILL